MVVHFDPLGKVTLSHSHSGKKAAAAKPRALDGNKTKKKILSHRTQKLVSGKSFFFPTADCLSDGWFSVGSGWFFEINFFSSFRFHLFVSILFFSRFHLSHNLNIQFAVFSRVTLHFPGCEIKFPVPGHNVELGGL